LGWVVEEFSGEAGVVLCAGEIAGTADRAVRKAMAARSVHVARRGDEVEEVLGWLSAYRMALGILGRLLASGGETSCDAAIAIKTSSRVGLKTGRQRLTAYCTRLAVARKRSNGQWSGDAGNEILRGGEA